MRRAVLAAFALLSLLAAAAVAGDRPPVVVFLGDSLTAGHDLAEADAFPAVLGRLLAEVGLPIEVVNAGVSGDTSAGGVRRVDWILRRKPAIVVLELGANDGLRGIAPAETERNLREIATRCREAGARVLLVGMRVPPNLGPDFARAFEAIYPRLAKELGVPLVPFLLEDVAGKPELNLSDGIHPNPRGQIEVAKTVRPALERLLRAMAERKPAR